MSSREHIDPETGEVQIEMFPRLDENGHEVPDPRPLRLPAGFKKPETLAEQVQRLVRGALSRQAEDQGFESFEDAEDFDVGDDEDPHTQYEAHFDPVLGKDITAQEFRQNQERYKREYIEAQQRYYQSLDAEEARQRRRAGAAEAHTGAAPAPTPQPASGGQDSTST